MQSVLIFFGPYLAIPKTFFLDWNEKIRNDHFMGFWDKLADMTSPKETEEEKKKRLAKQRANNPFLSRLDKYDKIIKEAEK